MGMKLTNDKKRREFIENPDNWETVNVINGLVMLKRLEYKELEWFSIHIRQGLKHWDYRKEETVKEIEWRRTGLFQLDKDDRAFTCGISVSEMMEQIKKYDKEHPDD